MKFSLLKNIKVSELIFASILVAIGVGLRLLPHPPNFTPLLPLALFGGAYFSRRMAFIIPAAAMTISDAFIGHYEFVLMAFVYGSFLLCVFLGFWLKKHKKWRNILASSVLAAVLFYLVTNFAVWAFTPWYAKTLSGLFQSYIMALPFFKNTLMGSLFYTTLFFGAYEMANVAIRRFLSYLDFFRRQSQDKSRT